MHNTVSYCLLGLWVVVAATGCSPQVENEVRLHSTVDQEISAPILSAFHRAQNKLVRPTAIFSNAGVDREELIDRIHSKDPDIASDVLWTDDILLMIQLEHRGLLKPHSWQVAADFPANMKAEDGTWCGIAAIARVVMVNTDKLSSDADHPKSVDELADPRWRQRCAIATPLLGTAAIHAAVIAQQKGVDDAYEWFKQIVSNAVVLPSNSAVASAVAAGRVDWGLTDSNYAVAYQDQSSSIAIVFPDQSALGQGTLRIPNGVAILAGAPHPVAAAQLADYLVLPTTEDRLAMSDTAQIPLSRQSNFRPRVLSASPVRWASADFSAAYDAWNALEPRLRTLFASAEGG